LNFQDSCGAFELAPDKRDAVPRACGFDKAGRARRRVMVFGLFRKDPRQALIERLYDRVAAASRRPWLYLELGIPDTAEGRFETLALHVILVLRRLQQLPAPAGEVAQELTDTFFRHLEGSIRELGVGDVVVPKRMKSLAESFFGRIRAYAAALDAADGAELAKALARNVYGTDHPAEALAGYVLRSEAELAGLNFDALLQEGRLFPQGPSVEEETRP
jgi:cytochrome b pre-mRNA-processing protein 3